MNPERLRQIAILVDSLETEAVDRLLEQLPDHQQQAVRDAVMALDRIDPTERQRVLTEFRQGFSTTPTTAAPSANLRASEARAADVSTRALPPGSSDQRATYGPPTRQAGNLGQLPPSRWHDPQEPTPFSPAMFADSGGGHLGPSTESTTSDPQLPLSKAHAAAGDHDLVETLETVDLESLAAVVLRESPQVLAVVLALLPPLRCAQLLEFCPADLQSAALARLRDLTALDDEIVSFLQQELCAVARQKMRLRGHQRVGPAALADIWVAAQKIRNPAVTQTLQAQLRGGGTPPAVLPLPTLSPWPVPATTPAPAPTVPPASPQHDSEARLVSPDANQVDALADVEIRLDFADLAHCDTPSLQALLATAKPKLTLLALKGASPQLLERVLKMLPRAEAKEVQFRIQNLGPTRIQDIQRAQTYLLRLATLLEDAGRFKQPRRRAG